MTHASKYFYGNKISDYGIQNKRVDYATLAKSFDCVLNNDIITELSAAGFYFEEENTLEYKDAAGDYYTAEEAQDRTNELEDEKTDLEAEQLDLDEESDRYKEIESRLDEINEDLEALADPDYKDIFQYYIVSDNGADILREAGEALFYNDKLDMYVWGVDHWGTSWGYVLTNITLNLDEE